MSSGQGQAAGVLAARRLRLPPLRAANLPLAAFGMGVSAYLSYIHWRGGAPLCGGLGDCETVQGSEYAEAAGVPVAALGLAMYAAIFALAAASLLLSPVLASWSSLSLLGIALAGALYSAYLTWLEIGVIHAICVWCVASAITVIAILVIGGIALLRDGVVSS